MMEELVLCGLCGKKRARTLCESDQANLCWDCDATVHGANFLVAKHVRLLLCRLCHSPTPWKASGPSLPPSSSSLCHPSCSHIIPTNSSSSSSTNHHLHHDDDEDVTEDEEEEGENQVVPWSSSSSSSAAYYGPSTTFHSYSPHLDLSLNQHQPVEDEIGCSSSKSEGLLANNEEEEEEEELLLRPWKQPRRGIK